VSYLIYFIVLVLSIIFYFKIAYRFNIIDKPNQRSSHINITLRGGGIIFYLGAFFWFVQSGFTYPFFFLGLSVISLMSFLDDIRSVSRWLRFVIHLAAMLLLFYELEFFSGPYLYIVIVLIVTTGFINAYNFMDGINGITGLYSLVLLSCFWFINNYLVSFISNDFIYFIGMALLVFNFYNTRRRAKCFAGDVGSVSIAFILLFLLEKLIFQTGDFTYLVLLAVYGVDSVLTIIHRLILGENIFNAHRKHLYQLLANELHIPQLVVASSYALLQLLVFICFVLLRGTGLSVRFGYLITVVISLSFVYFFMKKKYHHLYKIN